MLTRPKTKMANNEAALAVVWSGDAAYAIAKNDKLAYALPQEGTNYWFDSMVIPKMRRITIWLLNSLTL